MTPLLSQPNRNSWVPRCALCWSLLSASSWWNSHRLWTWRLSDFCVKSSVTSVWKRATDLLTCLLGSVTRVTCMKSYRLLVQSKHRLWTPPALHKRYCRALFEDSVILGRGAISIPWQPRAASQLVFGARRRCRKRGSWQDGLPVQTKERRGTPVWGAHQSLLRSSAGSTSCPCLHTRGLAFGLC